METRSIAPSEQHDNAAAEDVEPSSLLPESSVEPPLASNLHGLVQKAWCKVKERKNAARLDSL